MMKVRIVRGPSSDSGTFGVLSVEGHPFACVTGELPWYNNKNGVSCILQWRGKVFWSQSPSRKNKDGSPQWTYRLMDVPNREGVLIHNGNFCGDKGKGYRSDVQGCILLGQQVADIEDPRRPGVKQRGVTNSTATVVKFVEVMKQEPFELDIYWATGSHPQSEVGY